MHNRANKKLKNSYCYSAARSTAQQQQWMETFLSKKGSLDAKRAVGVHGKGPSKPNARPSNLLFNPQPRPRQRIPWPTSTNNENAPGRERQQEGGGGYASSYSKLRVSRRERWVRCTAMLGWEEESGFQFFTEQVCIDYDPTNRLFLAVNL